MFKNKKIMNNLFRLEVEKWALNSKENEEFRKYKMYILNIGNEECINYRGV